MTDKPHIAMFKDAGHAGVDTRHVTLRVFPVTDTQDGQLITKQKVFIEGSDGNFTVDMPTFFIFGILDEGWVFESFEQNGKTWPGIAINPDDGDIEVSSDDPTHRTLIMHDKCESFCLHHYQIVLKHTATGEIATTDPSVQNVDRQNSLP